MTTFLKHSIKLLTIVATLGLATVATTALATKTASGEYNSMHAGLGAKGYDVVAYFSENKPVQGTDRHTAEYGGVKWQFSSADNLATFKKDPAKYAPQFGGYCAWGASIGKLFDVDPVNGWKVVDGKLYLNFNGDINATFSKAPQGFIDKANQNWAGLNK
jgi:YHS domain-containing protein